MAVCYLIADALLVQFVEEGIEVVVFRKQLHEADAERAAGSADLYQNGMQRGGFGLDLANVPLGSSHRCPPYIAQRDGGVLTKCLMGLCQQLVTHRQGWYLLKSCHTVVHAVVISQQVVGIVLQGYPLAAIADRYRIRFELMNAADFKVPQERLRVIIVGIRKDLDGEYFFPVKVEHAPITLYEAIGDLNALPVPYNDELVNPQKTAIPNHDYYIGPFDQKFMARNRIRGWDELLFTIQAQAKNEPLHPQAPKMEYASANRRKFVVGSEHLYRRLSVRECASPARADAG